MLADRAVIQVKAGNGGDGAVSFRREKYVPKGGPDGGDGGDGGDIVFIGDHNIHTLLDFRGRHHWSAENGHPGQGKNMAGADGRDTEIRLPPGTMVLNDATGALLCDLREGDRVVIAKGGRGGFGNAYFRGPTNQTPRSAEPGERGEELLLRLDLKLIADVGLIGMPNAGKSTLLSALTRARPKIADYPFTTLTPQLGIAELDTERRLVVADIPGLIEGAAGGAGLGHDFLRHVERTRLLVHVLDVMPPDGSNPADNYRTIRKELAEYSGVLAEKEEIIALNKLDLFPDQESRDERLRALLGDLRLGADVKVFGVSAASQIGLRPLLEACWSLAMDGRRPAANR